MIEVVIRCCCDKLLHFTLKKNTKAQDAYDMVGGSTCKWSMRWAGVITTRLVGSTCADSGPQSKVWHN